MMAKISFSMITLATAASAVDIDSFLTRMAGSQTINCQRSGSRPRSEKSCMNHYPECTWVSQCQAAQSYCDGRFYSDCLTTSNCVWVGQPGTNNGYCELDTSCGDFAHSCESSCLNDDLCEWAEGCQTNDYGVLSDCGGVVAEGDSNPSEDLEVTDSEDRRLDSSRNLCRRHTNSISCNGDYLNDCTWTGFCHSKATPIQQPCGMLYTSSACGKFDHCLWNGNNCVETSVRQQPCGMLYSNKACSGQSHCAWNGSTCVEYAIVTQPCGMLYANEACYSQEHCRWDGTTCRDGPAPDVICGMFYSPSACWDQYHWTRDAGRKRFRHREACDWHFILDTCITA